MSKFKPSLGSVVTEELRPATDRRARARSANPLHTAIISSSTEASEVISRTVGFESPISFNPARQFAFKCTLLFLYFRFSFLHEFISSTIHVDTHILIILGSICYLSWFLAGNLFAAFNDRLAWVWAAFVAWMCLATVGSIWRGGSFAIVSPYLRTIFPLLLLIPAVVWSIEDVKKLMNVIGIAGTSTVLFGLFHRNFSQGRLDIGTDNSSIQDPNDFAAQLIVMLPAIAYVLFAKQRSVAVKIFGVGVMLSALLEVMSTGSRGGFVALVLTSIYIAITGSPKLRMFIFLGVPLMGMLALPFVPKESVARILSLVDSQEASESAAESSEARRALLMESLRATANHPILGVGPAVFKEYQAGMAEARNQKGMWHETHNGYTEISSECGIPALILYLTAVIMALKSLRRASKLDLPVIPMAARTLMTMIVGFSSGLIFLAQGYRFTMLVVGAITIAINQVIARSQNGAPA